MYELISSRLVLLLFNFLALDDNEHELFIGSNEDLIVLGFETKELEFIRMVKISNRRLCLGG